VDEQDKEVAFVHSTPISAEVFDKYYLVISKVFSQLYEEGVGRIGGPRIADKLLRDVAKEMKIWDTPDGVQRGLMAEIYRLTNVMSIKKEGGWELLPYELARKNSIVSAGDASEIEAAIVFFIVLSATHRKSQIKALVGIPLSMLDARITSLGCTEYMNSLTTATPAASSGEKAA
jgi:hypothetical protein